MSLEDLSPREYLQHIQSLSPGIRDLSTGELSDRDPVSRVLFASNPAYILDRSERFGEATDRWIRGIYARLVLGMPDLPRDERDRLLSIPVGGLTTCEPNARVLPVPSGGVIIVLDTSLAAFLGCITTILLMLSMYDEDPKLTRHAYLADKMPSVESLLDALRVVAEAFKGGRRSNLNLAELAAESLPALLHLQALVEGQVSFVIAHELAHIALGHTHGVGNRQLAVYERSSIRARFAAYQRKRSEELEADSLGSSFSGSVAIDAMDEKNLELLDRAQRARKELKSQEELEAASQWAFTVDLIVGPELFFLCLYLLEATTGFEFREDATHPPALERFSRLRDVNRSSTPWLANRVLEPRCP